MQPGTISSVVITVAFLFSHASSVNCTQIATVSSYLTGEPEATSGKPNYGAAVDFILANMTEEVRKEFEKAWEASKTGTTSLEGLALLYREQDGSLLARAQRSTNQSRQVSFKWTPNLIAIVHTHPNANSPEPSSVDMELSDRFQIPIFTLTNRGMFVYDPHTRKISKLMKHVRWLPSRSGALHTDASR